MEPPYSDSIRSERLTTCPSPRFANSSRIHRAYGEASTETLSPWSSRRPVSTSAPARVLSGPPIHRMASVAALGRLSFVIRAGKAGYSGNSSRNCGARQVEATLSTRSRILSTRPCNSSAAGRVTPAYVTSSALAAFSRSHPIICCRYPGLCGFVEEAFAR